MASRSEPVIRPPRRHPARLARRRVGAASAGLLVVGVGAIAALHPATGAAATSGTTATTDTTATAPSTASTATNVDDRGSSWNRQATSGSPFSTAGAGASHTSTHGS